MKQLLVLLLAFFLAGCTTEKESCYTCQTIFYSNERMVCGFANNGEEEIKRINLGEVCGDENKRLIIQENTASERVPASCGALYTIRQTVTCR